MSKDDTKKDKKAIKDLTEAAEKLKSLLDDTSDIVPGLGMMIHGIAHAVVEAMAPPTKLLELKDEKGPDFKLSQSVIEAEYPEIAAEIEHKGKLMSELFQNCKALTEMSPKEVCKQATSLVQHHNMVKMTKDMSGSIPEGWSVVDKEDSEEGATEGADEVDAPLGDGWASKCKGNA